MNTFSQLHLALNEKYLQLSTSSLNIVMTFVCLLTSINQNQYLEIFSN